VTIAAFIIGGALAWLHFETFGPVIIYGIKVWVAWMGAVTIALIWQSWRLRDRDIMVAGCVLFASYILANFTWVFSSTPLITHSARNVLVALIMLMIAIKSWRLIFLAPVALYVAIVIAAALTEAKILFNWPRPDTFLALSYPDIAAGFQHAALLVLSLGTRQHENASLERDPGYGGIRGVFGMAAVALRSREKDASS
jgi:hypothetical protein